MVHAPRPVQFALAERLSHLDVSRWNALTASSSVFLRAPFLTALERALPPNLSPRYALLYRGDEPLAALVMQLVRLEGHTTFAAKAPLGPLTRLVDERALVFGNLVAWGDTGLALSPGADVDLVWREALRLMDRLRRFEKLEGHVNVSFVKDTGEHEAALRRHGYQAAPSGPDMQFLVDPRWATFNDYLASLSAKARYAVKKTLSHVDAAGYAVRALSLEEVERHEARLDALYGQVWANAEVRPIRLSGRFFVELKRRLGDDCALVGLVKGERLDAFGVCLRSDETCVGYYLGYEKSVEAPLYLRLLISILERAIAWRSGNASLGRTSEYPKSRLGAVPGASSLWVRHRTPPLNWAVGAVLGTLEEAEVPAHHVFREEKGSASNGRRAPREEHLGAGES